LSLLLTGDVDFQKATAIELNMDFGKQGVSTQSIIWQFKHYPIALKIPSYLSVRVHTES
jgi:hypothetical protein